MQVVVLDDGAHFLHHAEVAEEVADLCVREMGNGPYRREEWKELRRVMGGLSARSAGSCSVAQPTEGRKRERERETSTHRNDRLGVDERLGHAEGRFDRIGRDGLLDEHLRAGVGVEVGEISE